MKPLSYEVFDTDWGWVAVTGSDRGIQYATLPEDTPDAALASLAGISRGRLGEEHAGWSGDFKRQTRAYLQGELTQWRVTLDWSGAPPFFQQAWAACQTIPSGETRTYGWLAAEAGRPAAVRAAGQAMARNRVPLVVPCHRVVGSNGGLVGFGGMRGLSLKAQLLAMEHSVTDVTTSGA